MKMHRKRTLKPLIANIAFYSFLLFSTVQCETKFSNRLKEVLRNNTMARLNTTGNENRTENILKMEASKMLRECGVNSDDSNNRYSENTQYYGGNSGNSNSRYDSNQNTNENEVNRYNNRPNRQNNENYYGSQSRNDKDDNKNRNGDHYDNDNNQYNGNRNADNQNNRYGSSNGESSNNYNSQNQNRQGLNNRNQNSNFDRGYGSSNNHHNNHNDEDNNNNNRNNNNRNSNYNPSQFGSNDDSNRRSGMNFNRGYQNFGGHINDNSDCNQEYQNPYSLRLGSQNNYRGSGYFKLRAKRSNLSNGYDLNTQDSNNDDENQCISQCVFAHLEVLGDARTPSETLMVKWVQDHMKDKEMEKINQLRILRRCFARLTTSDIDDGCEFSTLLSKCLRLNLEK